MLKLSANNQFVHNENALYLSIDGGEGTGKTTWGKYFNEVLRQRHNVLAVKEPGFTEVGQFIRNKVLGQEQTLDTQINMFLSDRILTQQLFIKPHLQNGGVVISDRSVVSSMVYQGLMAGDLNKVINIHAAVPDLIYPQLAIIATCPVDIALSRVSSRYHLAGHDINYLDEKEKSFHEEIHKHFSNVEQWYPYPFIKINFNRPVEEITEDVLTQLKQKYNITL